MEYEIQPTPPRANTIRSPMNPLRYLPYAQKLVGYTTGFQTGLQNSAAETSIIHLLGTDNFHHYGYTSIQTGTSNAKIVISPGLLRVASVVEVFIFGVVGNNASGASLTISTYGLGPVGGVSNGPSPYDFGIISPAASTWGAWTLHQRQTVGSPSGGQVYVTTATQITMDTGANSHQTKEILLINSLAPFSPNEPVELFYTLQ